MSSDVLGPSETRLNDVPPLRAKLWWSFNDRDGMILRFYDGDDLAGERTFPDIIEAEAFFRKLLTLEVIFGHPAARPAKGSAHYWLAGNRWMVQVGTSVADELATDAVDRVEAAEAAAVVAAAARA